MKKTNLIKMLVVMIISVMVMFFNTCVLAAEVDEDGYEDLTEALGNSSSNSSNTGNNSANTNTNNSANNNSSNTNTNRANNSSNTSIYNNSSLPKTGLSDSVPVVLLVVVFGASAIYAYKKVNEYKNI